jgi:crotonobetainyl-CoA:carnitine CoA-transferase CaiB-like acyl-CoA transferase
MTRDLEGLLVIAVEQAVAAPYCTARLADAGARVIKVERPEGDFARRYDRLVQGESAYFVWLNRGKESCRVDLKAAADRRLLAAMIARADVLVQNMGPGVMARFGFASAELRARHPRLITCDVTGYGSSGPFATQKAYDLLVQAESGLAAVNGGPEGPARVGVSVADIACGMNAFAAILQALVGRGVNGRGRGVEVSLFHSLADWMNVPDLQYRYGGHTPARLGLHHPTIAPYGAYACRDGAVLLAIQNEAEWERFCADVLEDAGVAVDPRFATNPDRVANRAALDRRIEARFAEAGREAVVTRLAAAGIAYGRLSTLADLARHPQRRDLALATPAGEVSILAPPVMGEGAVEALGPVPALGAHDAAIRGEFGEAG